VPPDADGLRGFARGVEDRHGPVVVCAAIESMNGVRFVHDTLERCGWEVEVADALKVKGLAPLACKTDRIDAWVLAELSRRDLVPGIWLPAFEQRQERERARWRLFLVRKRSSLKHRVHAQLLAFGHTCPVSDLFGVKGRKLLERLDLPDPWRGGVLAALAMIDELDHEIGQIDREARQHRRGMNFSQRRVRPEPDLRARSHSAPGLSRFAGSATRARYPGGNSPFPRKWTNGKSYPRSARIRTATRRALQGTRSGRRPSCTGARAARPSRSGA